MVEQKLTVLLVDDDLEFLQMTKEMLIATGKFRIFLATSGTEAFGRVRNLNIDLMVSDLRMPKMNGIDLIEGLRTSKALQKLPVLFLTGSPDDVPSALLLRPNTDLLGKPYHGDELVQKILNLIKGRKMQEVGQASVDAKIMDSFVQSTSSTLKELLKVSRCDQGKLFMMNPNLNLPLDVTGAIYLSERSFQGNLMVSFPRKTLNKLFGNGQFQIENHEKLQKRAEELIFVIWDKTRLKIDPIKEDLKKTLPKVVEGGPQNIKSNSDSPIMVMPFMTEHGEFYIMFSVEVIIQKQAA